MATYITINLEGKTRDDLIRIRSRFLAEPDNEYCMMATRAIDQMLCRIEQDDDSTVSTVSTDDDYSSDEDTIDTDSDDE